jgi:hypothetical protein
MPACQLSWQAQEYTPRFLHLAMGGTPTPGKDARLPGQGVPPFARRVEVKGTQPCPPAVLVGGVERPYRIIMRAFSRPCWSTVAHRQCCAGRF